MMLSIRPEHARDILDGVKTVELRRRFPDNAAAMWLLLYASSPTRALLGAANIQRVHRLPLAQLLRTYHSAACVSKQKFKEYFAGRNEGFALVLSATARLQKPIPLEDLRAVYNLDPVLSYRWICRERAKLLSDCGFSGMGKFNRE